MSNTVSLEQNMANNPVAAALQGVLSDTYALYFVTHNYHWNVEGAKFVSLHNLFEQHYTELFAAIDEIAERIRAVGEYARSFEDTELMSDAQNLPRPEQGKGDAASVQMIQNLVTLHEKVVVSAQKAKEAAANAGDDESEDLMIARITTHQKAIWMLRSIIK